MQLPPRLNWLRPPTFQDRAKTRQAAMVWSLLWVLLLTSLPILSQLNTGSASYTSLALADVMMIGLLALTKRGSIFIASFAVPTVVLVLITYISIRSDGVHDVAVVGYSLVIAIAGVLVGTRALIAFTLLVVAAYGAMGVAEINGVLVNKFSLETSTEDVIIFAAICTIFAILLRVTLQTLFDNLQLAETNAQAVVERNIQLEASRSEIQRLNTDLELRIAERTADLQSATDENEQLYNISRDVNSAQDYVELVEAVARHLDHPEYAATLSLYDTQDKATARIVSVVAQRPSGKKHAVPIVDDHYLAENVRESLAMTKPLVIHDVFAPPPEMHPRLISELKMQKARAFMLTELTMNTRVLGYLMLGLPYAHEFSPHDIRVLRAAADLSVAAIERIRLYSEQVDTAARLRDADEVKSRFLANMSHELRTPLNAILNFTRFVSSGMLGTINAEQLDALNKTITSGKHLLSLINDVLDVTKIESQMLTLFIEANVDLNAELEAAIAAGESLIGEKPVKMVRDIAPDLPPITGDRRRLRQVLLNLVSNACKFTDEGTVTVHVHREGDLLHLYVRDTGPGIAPEDHEIIFEPFRQSKRGQMLAGGTGLGLAIARRLVEAHFGSLTVESVPGEGATFNIVLPVSSMALMAQLDRTEAHP